MKRIHIYCDGGFANRYNTLVSGLAAARELSLNPLVSWPCNNWCQASFEDVIDYQVEVDRRSISQLKGDIDTLTPLLQDELGARTLGVEFNSAYAYKSLDDVRAQALAHSQGLFYYPALVPSWIPPLAVSAAVKSVRISSSIVEIARRFINEQIGQPYYGIHLRRTDLRAGLSDDEVRWLVGQHSGSVFYVCSDDSLAERLAAAHGNVRIRTKSAYATKRVAGASWNQLTLDDDGRPYHCNIERDNASVIEAVVDLLILAHSAIVGYSGSTFQAVARMIGREAPVVAISQPEAIDVLALDDLHRQLMLAQLKTTDVLAAAAKLQQQGRSEDAIRWLQRTLNNFSGMQAFPILFNLAVALMDSGRHGEAEVFALHAADIKPDYADAWILAARSCEKAGRLEDAKAILDAGLERFPAAVENNGRNRIHDELFRLLGIGLNKEHQK